MELFKNFGRHPEGLTFDRYGTLIQWDEGLLAAVQRIPAGKVQGHAVFTAELISVYDRYEPQLVGNVAQLGGIIDPVISAQQAQAYKPSLQIFAHTRAQLGIDKDVVVHISASPHLDMVASRDIGFRCIWIDSGTARRPFDDYTADAILPRLDRVPLLFKQLGW